MNKELKNGDECYVSDISVKSAIEGKNIRLYVGKMSRGGHICENINGKNFNHIYWKYAVPTPKPETNPWTLETIPALPICIRYKDSKELDVILRATESFLSTYASGRKSYQDLMKYCEWVVSSNDVRPCGVISDG